MLKRTIKYQDFEGEDHAEVFYFNLSSTEIIELELDYEGGLEGFINRVTEAKDGKTLIKEFQKLILLAYGQKSPDGKRFIKTDEMRAEFTQTAAYDALFMELAMDADAAAQFMNGIIPANMAGRDQDKPANALPPPPPLHTDL